MSIQQERACLEELAVLDLEIRELDELLAQDRSALAELKHELERLDGSISKDTTTINEMNKTRQDLVLEVRQVANQVEKSRDKLNRSRNERETNAATRELEELRRIQKDREEEIGKLQVLESQAQKSKDEAEAARSIVLDKLNATEGATSDNIGSLEQQRQTKLERRKRLIKDLPRNVLSRYDMIRGRRGSGIAFTRDGTCEACHMTLPPQLFQKILRSERMEQCPSCQRILFYQPPEPEGEGQQS